jgi:hypothetical protein
VKAYGQPHCRSSKAARSVAFPGKLFGGLNYATIERQEGGEGFLTLLKVLAGVGRDPGFRKPVGYLNLWLNMKGRDKVQVQGCEK